MAGGLITSEQVDQALRAQVMWGGRLGTNLIELAFVDLDQLSRTLGLQHDMPSALARHFDKIDKDLQKLLSPDVAERFSVVPLIKVGPDNKDHKVLIAAIGPLEEKALAIVADDMGFEPAQIVVTVAAELRIRYQLERAYNIPRSSRFLRARGPAFPQFTTAPEVGETSDVDVPVVADDDVPVAIDDDSSRRNTSPVIAARSPATPPPLPPLPAVPPPIPRPEPPRPATIDDLGLVPELDVDPDPEPGPSEEQLKARRSYVRLISESAPAEAVREVDEVKALGRIALRRVAAPPPLVTEVAPPTRPTLGTTLGEATRAIRRATDRDRVVDLMMMTAEKFAPACDAALLLVVRGDAAIGWRGFSRNGRKIPEIAVPLDQSPLARAVVETRTPSRCVCDDLEAIDTLLFRALGGEDGQLVCIPVVIGEQVMCVVAMVGEESSEVEAIAAAGGAAFARLMRDASR